METTMLDAATKGKGAYSAVHGHLTVKSMVDFITKNRGYFEIIIGIF